MQALIPVASTIEAVKNPTWRDTLRAGWSSFRITASAILTGSITQAYIGDGCRSVSDFRVWATDGHLLGFVIASFIAPAWRATAAYQRSKNGTAK